MYEVFKTQRLVMRPLAIADAKDFAALVNHPEICRMTGTFPYPFPEICVEGKVEIFVASAATGRAYHWAILDQGQFAGVIGIYRKPNGWDLGYWLGQPFWGQGFGSEVVSGLIEHLSKFEDNLRMSACVFTDNPASAKILRKVGFEQDETVCAGYSLARRGMMDNWTFTYHQPTKDQIGETGRVDRELLC